MAGTRDLKRRMKAVGNIKRITKTMQMIATARYQSVMRRVTQAKPHSEKIRELVGELAATLAGDQEGAAAVSHPLLTTPQQEEEKRLILVLTSNRGLCGGYNGNVLRLMHHYIRDLHKDGDNIEADLHVVGKKGVGYCKFNQLPVDRVLSDFSEAPTYEQVERVADEYMDMFIKGKYTRVEVVFMSFESMGRQHAVIQQLLPLEQPAGAGDAKGADVDYDFSPEPKELLEELLPATVKIQLYQWFNEAVLSEHIARMVAMKNATDSATKMGKSLTRKFNRARQTAITTELSEIIGGAAALE